MNRILFFIILSLFFHSEVIGKELNQFEKLAGKYAEVVGGVELVNVAFSIMNKRCKTKFENSSEFLFEVDYYLRQKTDYTFEDFVKFVGLEKETNTLANQLVEELIQDNGGCNTTALEHWFKFVVKYNEENHLVFLRQNKSLFDLPKIIRTDNQIEKAFNQKIKEYKNLSYKELFDLASALGNGTYHYSMFGYSKITKNIEQSLELWRFSIEKFNEPQAYYYIGKLLQYSSTRDAFSAFEQSAKQGYKYGEIWLGTYYACNKDTIKSQYWLDIAKKGYKEPDYIDDIYAEIDELGMPTNCMDGWVY